MATLPEATIFGVDLFHIHTGCPSKDRNGSLSREMFWRLVTVVTPGKCASVKENRSAIQLCCVSHVFYLHSSNGYVRTVARSFARSFDRSIVRTCVLFLFPAAAKNRTNRVRSQRRTMPTAQATADATTVPLTKSPNIISDTPNGETVKQFNVDDYDSEHLVRHTEDNRESSTSPICCYNSIAKLKSIRNHSVHDPLPSQWGAYTIQHRQTKNGVGAVDHCECRRIRPRCVCCCCVECQSSDSAASVASTDAAPNSAPHSAPTKPITAKSIVLNNNNNSLYKNKNCDSDIQQLNGVSSPSFDSRVYACDSGNCDCSIGGSQRCRGSSDQNLKKLICCSTHVRGADKQTAKLLTIGASPPVQRTPLCKKLCDTDSSSTDQSTVVFPHRKPADDGFSTTKTDQPRFCTYISCRCCRRIRTNFFNADTASRRLTSSEAIVHSEYFSAPVKSVNINANDSKESIFYSDNQNNRIIQNGDAIATRRLILAHRSSTTKQQIDLLRSHFKDVAITSSETPTQSNVHQAALYEVNSAQTQPLSPASAPTKYYIKSDQNISVRNDRGASSPRNTDHKYERPLTENNVSNRTVP